MDISLANASIERLIVHQVGNKNLEERLMLSQEPIRLDDEILNGVLKQYFHAPFKNKQPHRFTHHADLIQNELYLYVRSIFNQPEGFADQSKLIARLLYESSTHPNTKPGDLYVAYFTDCMIEDEIVSAIGLFKSESKQTYLTVYPDQDNLQLKSDEGVDINKLDKGAIIFNTEADQGYVVLHTDRTNNSEAAVYWVEDFLNIAPVENEYVHTTHVMETARVFVAEEMAEAPRHEKADFLNKTTEFIQDNPVFDQQIYTDYMAKD
jgi:hypothetical protein